MTSIRRDRAFGWAWVAAIAAGIALLIPGLAGPSYAQEEVHHVTVVMKEFSFTPSVLHLKAGERVVLTIRNKGTVEHEVWAGQGLVNTQEKKGYRTDLIGLLKPQVTGQGYDLEKVSATPPSSEGMEGEYATSLSDEIDVQPGGVITLRFRVPESAKGRWQLACLVTGHYEAGMKGTVIIK